MDANYTSTCLKVIVTCPSFESAKEIAHDLVKNKLCACVNIIQDCYSVYEWQDTLYESKEFMLFIKTTESQYKDLEKRIIEIHPYDLPEMIAFEIKYGFDKYLAWIRESSAKLDN